MYKKVPDAVEVYRKILAEADDKSIVISSIGFINNLANLLQSDPDQYSQLTGVELVDAKAGRPGLTFLRIFIGFSEIYREEIHHISVKSVTEVGINKTRKQELSQESDQEKNKVFLFFLVAFLVEFSFS